MKSDTVRCSCRGYTFLCCFHCLCNRYILVEMSQKRAALLTIRASSVQNLEYEHGVRSGV